MGRRQRGAICKMNTICMQIASNVSPDAQTKALQYMRLELQLSNFMRTRAELKYTTWIIAVA